MSFPIVTCPSCKTQLRSDRPIPSGVSLRCPGCRASFTHTVEPPPPPPPTLVLEEPRLPSLFGPSFVIALTVSMILGLSIVAGAFIVLASRPAQPQVALPSTEDNKTTAQERERQQLGLERKKLDLARLLVRGETALVQNKFADAEKAFEEALKLEPESADALKGLVSAKASQATAKKVGEEEEKRTKEVERLLTDAKKAKDDKKLAKAIQLLEAARQLQPTKKEVLDELLATQNALDNDRTEKQKLTDFKRHMEAGKVAFAGERYQDAVREYMAALNLMPDDLEAQQGQKVSEKKLAGLADKEKREKAGNDLLERGRRALLDRRFTEAVGNLAAAQRLMGDRESARLLADAQRAKNQATTQNRKLVADANEAASLGRWEEAQRLAEEATKNLPEDQAAQTVLRNATRQLENARTAQMAYLRYTQQGALAMTTGRYADAVASYTEALRLAPTDFEIQRGLRAAQLGLERELRFRQEADLQLRAGGAALARRSYDEAIRQFIRVLKRFPAEPQAVLGLRQAKYGKAMNDGQEAMRQRRKDEAIRAFEQALSLNPGDQAATLALRQAQFIR